VTAVGWLKPGMRRLFHVRSTHARKVILRLGRACTVDNLDVTCSCPPSSNRLKIMLVLYETAMGFCLFKMTDAGKLQSPDLHKEFETAEKANSLCAFLSDLSC
jgi:hypothetical protein